MPHRHGEADLRVAAAAAEPAAGRRDPDRRDHGPVRSRSSIGLDCGRRRPARSTGRSAPERRRCSPRTSGSDETGATSLLRRRARGVLPRWARGRPAGGRARDRRPRDRAGARRPGSACTTRFGFARAAPFPGPTASDRARRDDLGGPDRTRRGPRPGRIGAARVRPSVGWRRRALRAACSAPSRANAMNPFRTMLDRGVEVGVGSDAPVTPLDPDARASVAGERITTRRSVSPGPRPSVSTRSGRRAWAIRRRRRVPSRPACTRTSPPTTTIRSRWSRRRGPPPDAHRLARAGGLRRLSGAPVRDPIVTLSGGASVDRAPRAGRSVRPAPPPRRRRRQDPRG